MSHPAAPSAAPATADYESDESVRDTSVRGTPDPTFDTGGRLTFTVPPGEGATRRPAPIQDALLISSETAASNHVHRPVLDIDVPARLVPSSTPGHHHLYLDVDLTWGRYRDLLAALAAAGVIEDGYVRAAEARGATHARLPWVRKVEQSDGVGR